MTQLASEAVLCSDSSAVDGIHYIFDKYYFEPLKPQFRSVGDTVIIMCGVCTVEDGGKNSMKVSWKLNSIIKYNAVRDMTIKHAQGIMRHCLEQGWRRGT